MSNSEIEKHNDSDLFLNEVRKHNTGLDSNHIIDELISEKAAFSKKELAKELKNRIATKEAQLKVAREALEYLAKCIESAMPETHGIGIRATKALEKIKQIGGTDV